ncbi:hypothetical protein L0U88_07510 [Flavihumibacter sp. RY-1]|uniref:Uncharacterized protein n=1 Tax=Flavihumibacter fluminis TaxID=2909236 RepID=A0ABS9BFI7_9BACT|nr:hypothetical protein [Flavihumibacter fluminis]MCF1714471.1 hypothetical protein [Flavihumibacter fluminis]
MEEGTKETGNEGEGGHGRWAEEDGEKGEWKGEDRKKGNGGEKGLIQISGKYP